MEIVPSAISALTGLKKKLDKRLSEDSFRVLRIVDNHLVDFCSNDYLGFARLQVLHDTIQKESSTDTFRLNGSTGSRLLSGNSILAIQLENTIAAYHKGESALLFNSGYDANLGLFSCVPQRGDTILYDELSHASILDGIRLSYANTYKFKHNDTKHLEELLKKSTGTIYIAVESVYSMDGDCALLKEISALCEHYNANLIVDEAHATGVFGENGKGLVAEFGLEQKVFARIHTFGKAIGCHGAAIVGSTLLTQYLINFSRPFIYSTALPQHSLIAIKTAYAFLENDKNLSQQLKENILFFKEQIKNSNGIKFVESCSPIQCILLGGNIRTKNAAASIQAEGYDVRAILSPTVAVGTERLRICLHTFNSREEITGLVQAIKKNS